MDCSATAVNTPAYVHRCQYSRCGGRGWRPGGLTGGSLTPAAGLTTIRRCECLSCQYTVCATADPAISSATSPVTGRNQPCPCGSGRKFKHCHGRGQPGSTGGPGSGQGSGQGSALSAQQRFQEAARLARAGQFDAAIAMAEPLPASEPRFDLLSRLYMDRAGPGDAGRAEALLKQWRRKSGRAEPAIRSAQLALAAGDPVRAEKAAAEARRRQPDEALGGYLQAVALQLQGRDEDSRKVFRQILSRFSDERLSPAALDLEVAIERHEVAAGAYPGSGGASSQRALAATEEYEEVRRALEAWQAGADDEKLSERQLERYANAWYNLGFAELFSYHRIDQAVEHFERALDLQPDMLLALTNLAFACNYQPGIPATTVAARQKAIGQRIAAQVESTPDSRFADQAAEPDRQLRIGYLSSDFRQHSVAHFIEPVLAEHDRAAFRVFAYHNSDTRDAVTERIAGLVDTFRAVEALSDDDLFRRIRADRIDLLVDLNGFTRGHRALLLARRAAPVQLHWLGYPATTGLPSMDYRIVDRHTDPPGTAEALCSENLLRLNTSFSVYQPPLDCPEPRQDLPLLTADGPLLASFNHLPKLNRPLLVAWAEILRQLPSARLMVKSLALDLPAEKARLLADFRDLGIGEERLWCLGRDESMRQHLSRYRQVDLCLDAYPYHGTTTTCDALYMGVPVLTRAGEAHVSRVGASLLNALALPQLVVDSEEDYIRRAVNLINDPQQLAGLRQGLRERMQASSLMDAKGLVAHYEACLKEVWNRWVQQTRQ